jgi:hypothetical protein
MVLVTLCHKTNGILRIKTAVEKCLWGWRKNKFTVSCFICNSLKSLKTQLMPIEKNSRYPNIYDRPNG